MESSSHGNSSQLRRYSTSTSATINEAKLWYYQNKSIYDELRERVQRILEQSLSHREIRFLYITSRLKSESRFLSKIARKREEKPNYRFTDVMDLAGIRVITRLHSEREAVNEFIKGHFAVDDRNSGDKELNLEVDRVGYRAAHWVAKFDESRKLLPDDGKYDGLLFEIQVCSILEHAWSESQHGGYELAGELPSDIMRRYMLLAAQIEVADREFDRLANDVRNYLTTVEEKTMLPELPPEFMLEEINSINLRAFIGHTLSYRRDSDIYRSRASDALILSEIYKMGIRTLKGLKDLIDPRYIELMKEKEIRNTLHGIIRDILVVHDAEEYFDEAWNHNWDGLSPDAAELWRELGVDLEVVEKYVDLLPR